jgi:hypothetical protein
MDPADKSAIGKLYGEGHAFPNLHVGAAAADPHFATISSRRDQSIDFNGSQES